MTKRAVIVGIDDYSQQQSLPPGWSVGNLQFCVADAQSMQSLLSSAFLFDDVSNIFTDQAATRDAIMGALQTMLSNSSAGDVACLVYSGHGGRFPADSDNSGRYYEAIIPASGAPITDLDIFNLASSLDESVVNFTLILDSCYSGGIAAQAPDSIARSASYTAAYIQQCVADMITVVPCGICLGTNCTGIDNNVSNVVGQGNGLVCSVDDNKSLVPQSKSTVIAACRYDEVDLEQNGHGVLTQGILDNVNSSNPSTTYTEAIDALRTSFEGYNVTQTATLLGQENRMDDPVLQAWSTSQ